MNPKEPAVRRSFVIFRTLGVLSLLIGICFAILAPLELQCFSMFSQGGRFGYEGFGFGSFMFANIAAQILFYATVAVVFIALGVGYLRLRRWSATLSVALLRAWLVVGIPVAASVFFLLAASKDLSLLPMVLAAVLLGLSCTVLPLLLIRFFNSAGAIETLRHRDTGNSFLNSIPVNALVVSAHSAFCILYLSVLILFGSLCPLFRRVY